MIKITLSNGKIAIIDTCDDHLSVFKWSFLKAKKFGYAVRSFKRPDGTKRLMFLHHAIVGYPLRKMVVDHINGDPLDNRRSNLRFITNRENSINKRIHRAGALPGASWCEPNKKWKSVIKINGKEKYLGYFKTQKEAHSAYKNAFQETASKSTHEHHSRSRMSLSRQDK